MVHHGACHCLFVVYSMVPDDALVDLSSMGQPLKKPWQLSIGRSNMEWTVDYCQLPSPRGNARRTPEGISS